jgi:hypothetical protein
LNSKKNGVKHIMGLHRVYGMGSIMQFLAGDLVILEVAISPPPTLYPFILTKCRIAFQAAAAMCVGMGSFADPEKAQGLAHFLGLRSLSFICYTFLT